jgi:ABC-2 type transport system ATP-binding protein
VDRPRRALLEEPDNVESYVAKRSLGFTQADSGDRVVVRPARAARPLEPSAVRTQPQTAGRDLSDPPMPRRATPAEPLSWDFDEKPTTTEPAAVGRRAIVDLEPAPSRQPVVPSQPAAPLAVRQAAPENPQPARSAPPPPRRELAVEPPKITAPPPPREPAVEPPKIAARWVPPPAPILTPAQPVISPAAHIPPPTRTEQQEPYRPAPPTDRPTTPLPRTPAVPRPAPETRRVEPVQTPSQNRTATPPRPRSGQTVHRAAAPAVHRSSPSTWTVHHTVSPIVVDRLIKSYNGTLAVHNLSFMVEPGRVTGFLGPNGAGKTTTMRILVGLVTPTTGTAKFGDLAYAELSHPQRTVGCVLDARFHPGRSGRNHLRVLAPTAGASDRRVDELLGEVGLGEVARQPVGEYSMGMQQRLALAAAMLGNPDYLILDEPANGLDPEGIRWLRTFLRDFAASGRAVLISSHLLNEIEATADDIVVINRGRLLGQMPMSELNTGEGTTRARVSDLGGAMQALAAIGADVETAADERGGYLRIHSHDVGQVGSVLFSSGIAVDELITERRDLEQEFFSMLEGSG